jgi:hypothetical protein
MTWEGTVFRFSIRELLLLTLIVALSLAWWMDRSRLRSEARREAQQLSARIQSLNSEARAMISNIQAQVTTKRRLQGQIRDLSAKNAELAAKLAE